MILTTLRLYRFHRRCGLPRSYSLRRALSTVWRDFISRTR